jgi:hypothetical protein
VSRVFGYVCLSDAGVPATVQRWRSRVGVHCQQEDLALELVFVDNGPADAPAARPGWTALLDVLGLDRNPGDGQPLVVLPGLTHLSEDLAVLTRMRAELDHAGARVVLMPRIPPHRTRREGTTNRPGLIADHTDPTAKTAPSPSHRGTPGRCQGCPSSAPQPGDPT